MAFKLVIVVIGEMRKGNTYCTQPMLYSKREILFPTMKQGLKENIM